MPNNFKVKVNKTLDFDLTRKTIKELDIIKTTKNNFHILQDSLPFKAEIVKTDFNKKKYTVKVNDNSYDVSIISELDLLINKMGFSLGKSKKINAVKSPMPGLILDINVKVGQKVKENDTLLVLEAMKMENSITSPRNGVIKSVLVTKDEAVDKGILLIEFES